jgi:hypothetical protein
MGDDFETTHLDNLTVQGGWRLLCVGLLHDAAQKIVESRNLFRKARGVEAYADKSWGVQQRDDWASAERWLQGGVGVITMEDCCELLQVSPEVARKKIEEYAHGRRREKPARVPW